MDLKIIDVWRPVMHDTEGRDVLIDTMYLDYDTAKSQCDSYGGVRRVEPEKTQALVIDGNLDAVRILQRGTFSVYRSVADMKKAAVLNKLTPEERKILGFT